MFELSSFVQNKNKLELHKKVRENTDFCNGVKPSEDTEILGSNQYCKSDKTSFIIYIDLEPLIEKSDGCKNNPEKSLATKVSEHVPSGFPISTISSFKYIGKMYDLYRGKDRMKMSF